MQTNLLEAVRRFANSSSLFFCLIFKVKIKFKKKNDKKDIIKIFELKSYL